MRCSFFQRVADTVRRYRGNVGDDQQVAHGRRRIEFSVELEWIRDRSTIESLLEMVREQRQQDRP